MTDAVASRAPAIAVWGHFHGRNLGDELVAAVIIEAIRRRVPDGHVWTISMSPRDAEQRHGVSALPINTSPIPAGQPTSTADRSATARQSMVKRIARRVPGARGGFVLVVRLRRLLRELPFTVRSYGALRSIDKIVVAGSGQLLDSWRGPWEHPYTTFRWALLARIRRTEMLYPSVGAGPIDGRLSAFMIRKAIEWAAFVSVRDQHTARVLRSIGVTRDLPFCPDMCWAYDGANGSVERDRERAAAPVVGVNVMSDEDPRYWPQGDAPAYSAYLDKMAVFIAHVLEDRCRVVMFSSQTVADRAVAEDLRQRLELGGLDTHPQLEWAIDSIKGVEDLARTVVRCDYVVAARFHSVLLPIRLGIPTLGLAYHAKTQELLEQIGKPERCLDHDRFEASDLVAAFARLREEDNAEERAALRERAQRLRTIVESQFDSLFGSSRPEASEHEFPLAQIRLR